MKEISLAKSPLSIRLDKEEARKTGRFIALFVLIYLILSVAFTAVIPEALLQNFLADTTASFFNGTVSTEENPIVTLSSGVRIEISPLCTGLTELFIIVAAIIASIGISLRKRLTGAAFAAIAVFLLNVFRIFATIAIILGSDSIAVVELAHNVLFRVFLFISIAAIYIAWFYWAVRSEVP